MNTKPLVALLLGAACSTVSGQSLLWMDNFDVPDNANFDAADNDAVRLTGSLASGVDMRSSRVLQQIQGNMLFMVNAGTGRIRFHDAAGWYDWANGTEGANILAATGMRIEFDWLANNDSNPNWISFNMGISGPGAGEPGFRVNHAETDIGILYRNNGATERFDNGANRGAGGAFPPVLTNRHVIIDYSFSSYADGSVVTVVSSVNGTEVINEDFDWANNAGSLYFELGTIETAMRIDNFAISTLVPVVVEDTDADGLPDEYENDTVGNLDDLTGLLSGPGPGSGTGDFDGDGVSDLDEFNGGTNPIDADPDGDGSNDGEELANGTDPFDPDTDDDCLNDGDEAAAGTDPLNGDTDSDGFGDAAEVSGGGDPLDPGNGPPLSPGFDLVQLSTDLLSGIHPAKTYTHTVSGGNAATVNGVLFESLNPGGGPANLVWDDFGFGKNQIPANNNVWDPIAGGVTGTGLQELLAGFSYSGGGAQAGSLQSYTLGALTPGETYVAYVYIRVWDKGGSSRPVSLTFANGTEIEQPAPIAPEDRPGDVLGNGNQDSAYYVSFTYTAQTSELVIKARVPNVAPLNSGSFHLYALSNEVDTGGDIDGDMIPDLLDTAYGFDAAVPNAPGLLEINEGVITNHGLPVAQVQNIPDGVDYCVIYPRRDDLAALGLSMSVEFSHNLQEWFPGDPGDAIAAGPGIEAVKVTYPFFLPNGRKGRFWRIVVSAL